MAGRRVILAGDRTGRISAFVMALGRFPTEPSWVVVGGFAVNVRLTQVHRLTNDLDTISAGQADLVEILLAEPGADRLGHAKVRFTTALPAVDIDVMDDTAGRPLPTAPGDRAFALARRYAMETREPLTIVVTDGTATIAESAAPVASVAALVALKSVSMPRRIDSNHPDKVGSDIHDLVRLVWGQDPDRLAQQLTDAGIELATWVGNTLVQWFSADADQRYTLARLRRLSNAVVAQSLDEDVLSTVGLLGRAVLHGRR